MIVVDASVVVDYLLGGPSPAGDALAALLVDNEPVSAPHLLDAEVGQVLRRFVLRGGLATEAAEEMLGELSALPMRRYEHVSLVARAFELRANVTMNDAVYLALAEVMDAPLLTADAGLVDVAWSTPVVDVRSTAGPQPRSPTPWRSACRATSQTSIALVVDAIGLEPTTPLLRTNPPQLDGCGADEVLGACSCGFRGSCTARHETRSRTQSDILSTHGCIALHTTASV